MSCKRAQERVLVNRSLPLFHLRNDRAFDGHGNLLFGGLQRNVRASSARRCTTSKVRSPYWQRRKFARRRHRNYKNNAKLTHIACARIGSNFFSQIICLASSDTGHKLSKDARRSFRKWLVEYGVITPAIAIMRSEMGLVRPDSATCAANTLE